ncbi:MAG: ATP-binding protein [Planctomycetota bacterium]
MDDMLSVQDTSNIPVDIPRLPIAVARCLLEDRKLKGHQRARLAIRVYGMGGKHPEVVDLYQKAAADPVEFGSIMMAANKQKPCAELFWNGRWYPVILTISLIEDHNENRLVGAHVETELGLGPAIHSLRWYVEPSLFLDEDGGYRNRTVLEVLKAMGFRSLQIEPREFNTRLAASERRSAATGEQVWVSSAVLDLSRNAWFASMKELPLGSSDMPRRGVIDSEIELDDDSAFTHGGRGYNESTSRMPFVRVFSFDLKRYVYVDIDDIQTYEYDSTALSRLYLPEDMKRVLASVFETPADELFGDLVRGKHGGIVVLACGNPGVGKTLTAEVYAEMAERPLYVLEFGELGTTVDQIEERLQKIFARIVRWQAVLQFDECEIFLSHRGESLERSAIVGIFLRMLDYYEGLLFLTTNRPDALDEAIRSRVMLRLEYPDLDKQGRAEVWRTMLEMAGMELVEGTLDEVAETPVNGRQIRNFVRLARILHPDRQIEARQLGEITQYGG